MIPTSTTPPSHKDNQHHDFEIIGTLQDSEYTQLSDDDFMELFKKRFINFCTYQYIRSNTDHKAEFMIHEMTDMFNADRLNLLFDYACEIMDRPDEYHKVQLAYILMCVTKKLGCYPFNEFHGNRVEYADAWKLILNSL